MAFRSLLVEIEVRDNQLVVSGERKRDHKTEEKGCISHERYHGSFMRSFTLPSNVKADQVQANYDNGVLQIVIPKAA